MLRIQQGRCVAHDVCIREFLPLSGNGKMGVLEFSSGVLFLLEAGGVFRKLIGPSGDGLNPIGIPGAPSFDREGHLCVVGQDSAGKSCRQIETPMLHACRAIQQRRPLRRWTDLYYRAPAVTGQPEHGCPIPWELLGRDDRAHRLKPRWIRFKASSGSGQPCGLHRRGCGRVDRRFQVAMVCANSNVDRHWTCRVARTPMPAR